MIDHSLGRLINDFLRRSGWNTVYVADAFLVDDQPQVDDDAIIARCPGAGLAWVAANERARYPHALAQQRHLIDVLFIHRPKDGVNMRCMWPLLASGLGHFEALTLNNPSYALHCEVRPPVPNTMCELNRLPRAWAADLGLTILSS